MRYEFMTDMKFRLIRATRLKSFTWEVIKIKTHSNRHNNAQSIKIDNKNKSNNQC